MRRLFSTGVFLLFVLPSTSFAASLSLNPATGSYVIGERVTVRVSVSTSGQSINAVSGTLSFSPSVFTVESVLKSGSVLNFWPAEPSFSQNDGTIKFEGVSLSGFQGNGGIVITAVLRAVKAGSGSISFKTGQVLANDGQGTDITSGLSGATYTISERSGDPVSAPVTEEAPSSALPKLVISSPTHPDQSVWYNTTDARFIWKTSAGATAVKLGYGRSPNTVPQVEYKPPVESKSLSLGEGVIYFAAQERTVDGWSPPQRYAIHMDITPPRPFKVAIVHETGQAPVIQFGTTDSLSGVERYEILLNDTNIATIKAVDIKEGSFELPPSEAGRTVVSVNAVDVAGNSTTASTSYISEGAPLFDVAAQPVPQEDSSAQLVKIAWTIANYLTIFFVLAGFMGALLFASWYTWHHMHRSRHNLIRRLAATDRELHAELHELQHSIKAEVERLRAVKTQRELTAHEHETLKILDNTQKVMAREFPGK